MACWKVKLGDEIIHICEIPEEEQLRRLEERRREWKPLLSRDGYIETWRRKFVHKGIAFELAILRYYTLDDGFTTMRRRVSDRHVVVEYPEETRPLVGILEELGVEEFLWHDTLHSWNAKQTLPEQLEEAYGWAISDIDGLPKLLDEIITKLKKKLKLAEDLRRKVVEASA